MTRRGQTMVLFVLTLLFLTLGVLVTLGVSVRTGDRIEAQMAADAAAYSEAVAAARTFNAIAVINRAEAATLVAMLGNQSLISWSGAMRASIEGMMAALDDLDTFYTARGCLIDRDAVRQAKADLAARQAAINAVWDPLDRLAAEQTRDWHAVAGGLAGAANAQYDRLHARITGQTLADEVVKRANPELAALPPGAQKSLDELNADCTIGVACRWAGDKWQKDLVMGTRGWTFVTQRSNGSTPIQDGLDPIIVAYNPGASMFLPPMTGGGAGYGRDKEGSQTRTGVSGIWMWAEDHGGPLTIDWPSLQGCEDHTGNGTVGDAHVIVSDALTDNDEHAYGGAVEADSVFRHTLLNAPLIPPGMWPGFFDMWAPRLSEPNNDFGQPKLYVIAERDWRNRGPEPWNLRFNFQFDQGAWFDNHRSLRAGNGTDLSKQIVLSAAIVYYHRPDAWQEPPNMFNPFWRATLARPDADAADRLDAAGYPLAGASLRSLQANGFRGVQ